MNSKLATFLRQCTAAERNPIVKPTNNARLSRSHVPTHSSRFDAGIVKAVFASTTISLFIGVAIANTNLPHYTDRVDVFNLHSVNAKHTQAADLLNQNRWIRNALASENLRHSALNSLSHQSPVKPDEPLELGAIDRTMARQIQTARYAETKLNVQSFLQQGLLSSNSRLNILEFSPLLVDVQGSYFKQTPDVQGSYFKQTPDDVKQGPLLNTFRGVGFPHIETTNRAESDLYKPYKQLIVFNPEQPGHVVANVACMSLTPVQVAKRSAQYDSKVIELALKHNVSASLIKAVIAAESCFDNKATSSVGAIGLMQLMPATAKWLNVDQPLNAEQNLAGGVAYLAQLRERFGSDELALAAYNAGPTNVERYNGIPPFAETQRYVKYVMHYYRGYMATTRFYNAQTAQKAG